MTSETTGLLKSPRRRCVRPRRRSLTHDSQRAVIIEITPTTVSKDAGGQQPAEAEETFSDWFRTSVLRSRWAGCFIAMYIQLVALSLLAALYFHLPEAFPPMVLNAVFTGSESFDEEDPVVIETIVDVADLDAGEVDTVQELTSVSALVPMAQLAPLEVGLPESFRSLALSSSEQDADQAVRKKADPLPVNVPKNAVSAGSFAVWTEPENPDPGEPYKIVIQVRLPDGTERYSIADLEGVVVGSDGYQKIIPGAVRGFLPVQDGHVRLEVHVVSADQLVEDTVFVKSKMLREAQRLQIRF